MKVTVICPAKINLFLKVYGKRPDGFHDIESLVQRVTIYDRITIARETEPGIRLSCSTPEVPSGPGNLAYKAASLVLEASGITDGGVSIFIEKHIPHGAGLGGGSSDAAAVMLGLADLFQVAPPAEKLRELAGGVGSDVPLFLSPSPSVITGRGEIVRPSNIRVNAFFVVVFPGFSVSTQWAYSNFRLTKKPWKYTISTLQKVEEGELAPDRWQDFLVNDLEPAVTTRHPEIGRCKEDLLRFGARASLMSGSGSAVFGLFEDGGAAERAEAILIEEGWHTAYAARPLFS